MTLKDRLKTFGESVFDEWTSDWKPETTEAATQIEADLLAIVGEDEEQTTPSWGAPAEFDWSDGRNQLRAELRTQIIKYCRGE